MASLRPNYGFAGLGNMGSEMAKNLASFAKTNGHSPVLVWNRTRQKCDSLRDGNHVEVADSIELLTSQCDVIHTCLANDNVALEVIRQILKAGRKGLIIVDHSTLFPTTSKTLQAESDENGISYCSCPVFGPPAAAKSASLLVVLSGQPEAQETLRKYIVPAIGKAVIECGEDCSQATLLKILGNNCILGTIELLSESFTLAEKTGFDVSLFYEFIEAWFPAAAWINYGKKIRDGSFAGINGFTLLGGMKDARFIKRLGLETQTPTPIIDQALTHLTIVKSIGGDSLDWSACAAGMRITAGLEAFKGKDFSIYPKNNSKDKQ